MYLKPQERELIEDYIMGKENSIPEYLKEEADNYYFAACLLMPKASLLRVIENFGGIDKVMFDTRLQSKIAELYRVPLSAAFMRITSIYTNEKTKSLILEHTSE